MQIRLAENIRALRRQHRFTQEQLAESLGVTPGAVYKWEAGLSQPELAIIVELADLFQVSMDVLIGYELRNNDRESVIERLKQYVHDRDHVHGSDPVDAISDVEKALQRYPNCFEIVSQRKDLPCKGAVSEKPCLFRKSNFSVSPCLPADRAEY